MKDKVIEVKSPFDNSLIKEVQVTSPEEVEGF